VRFFYIPAFFSGIYKHLTWQIPTTEKVIYLTFDDGPTTEVTGWILDLLDNYKAKATFFCVGNNVQKLPAIFQHIKDRGHSVGNHTFNHMNGMLTKNKVYMEDIRRAEELIGTKLFRPPYGSMNLRQGFALVKMGFKVIMWTVLSYDFDKNADPDLIITNTLKHSKPGTIIVFHDNIKSFERLKIALPAYLEHFSNQGYSFQAIG
jgi:peptidoglycan-N-acetylglucosamine deacetylase